MDRFLAILLALGFIGAACPAGPDEITGGPHVDDDVTQGDDDDQDDDDITGDDDSQGDDDQGDDDQGDDDTHAYDPAGCGDDDAAFVQQIGPFDLASGHAYSIYLMGSGGGPAQVLILDDTNLDPPETLPHFRFIHGAVSAPPVDVYHEGNLYSSLEHIEPGSVTPPVDQFNYWEMSWAGGHSFEVFETGHGPPGGSALAPAAALQMPADIYYSGVLTCAAGSHKLQIFPDHNEHPPGGTARLGLFHSVDGVGAVDVTIVEPSFAPLWAAVPHGTLAPPTEISWGTYVIEVTSLAN